jgi:hypothetical protein
MSIWDIIPVDFEPIQERSAFVAWLHSLPLSFHSRLDIYFRWLDYHTASYSADEIDSLKE